MSSRTQCDKHSSCKCPGTAQYLYYHDYNRVEVYDRLNTTISTNPLIK